MTDYQNSLDFARAADAADALAPYREQFFFPQHAGRDCLYFCGNSLGLQPKSVGPALQQVLDQWQAHGVEGHFRGDWPWMHYHKFLQAQSAALVGALPEEVVVMNTLSTNLHLMMVSFYRPDARRHKIIMEAGAFPSDQYAVESQVRFHGFDPAEAIIEVAPRAGEHTLRDEDILAAIAEAGEALALVLFGGVNYYTGQFYDLAAIARAGHAVGAQVGFDLAHAAGNLPLHLHDWGADFAVWCSYKYLNAGPGGPGGVFVHQRHAERPELPRFAGWWGHDEAARFQMRKGFVPMPGAAGWQLSNAQVLAMAAHKAGLDLFHAVGMAALRAKSLRLTGFLAHILAELNAERPRFEIITPADPARRGCQLSLLTDGRGRALFDFLSAEGVVCDWREPNVIRLAPVPFYNSFEDVYRLGQLLADFG